MPFVKGQSGNPHTKDFVDKLLHLYMSGVPTNDIVLELGITKKISCNKYGKEASTKVALKYIEDMKTLIEKERNYLEKMYAF